MVRDYETLCESVLVKPCFRGYEGEVKRIRILISTDLKLSSQYTYLATLKKYVEFARKRSRNPFEFDLVLVKEFLQNYKLTARKSYAMRLRKIFRLNGELADFHVKQVESELPETLSEKEINMMVEATESLKWRTLFRLTYEAAMREHEVLSMKIKHVQFDDKGAKIFVPSTKSQALWLRIIDSVPLLQSWVEMHSGRDNREAWLFPGRKRDQPLTYVAFYAALKRTAKKVGVKKRVFPHLLRHSRLKWLKMYGADLGISDSVICELYGRWSRRNAHRMLDRYGRIEPEEANQVVLRAYGKLGERRVTEPLAKPRCCPRCRLENDALSKYCRVCGMVLDEGEALRLTEERQSLENEVADLRRKLAVLDSPEVTAWLESLANKKR